MFEKSANWIWSSRPGREYNEMVCFRRTLEVSGAVKEATINITADSRYELYVNGTWMGHGPVRSWPSPWSVDSYDLRGLLKPGQNVVAVLALHIGVSTFQYLHAQEGVLAQVNWADAKGSHRLATDSQWRSLANEAFGWPVPRISCQQAWEEQYDARRAPGGDVDWRSAEFDDSAWPTSRVVRPVGQPPHEVLEPRDIPMLTREVVEPLRVVAMEAVRPARYTWSINLRTLVNPTDRTANGIWSRTYALTYIYSDKAQAIQVHQPHHGGPVKLNGKELVADDHSQQLTDNGLAHGKLKAGWNTFLCKLPSWMHLLVATFNIWTDKPIRFAAYPDDRAKGVQPWLGMGPFGDPAELKAATEAVSPWGDRPNPHGKKKSYASSVNPLGYDPQATIARYEAIWERGVPSEEDIAAAFSRPLSEDMVNPIDAMAISASDRPVKGLALKVDEPWSLQRDNAEWTTIHPAGDGCDARMLLDFGRGVIGYHEFEIDAPAGTIVDNHNFELIQRDGRYNLAEGMNNSFRYTCREGVQRYRTFVRRGFRYSWITLRNFNQPVRVRFIRVLMSTYPVASQGEFACSDPMLENIWHVGAHSVRCCSEDTYTDCPSYEQTHWVGDARNEALVDLVANGDPRLSRHCWIQTGRSMDRSAIVESHVPSGWRTIVPAWTFLWMRWAQEHYMLTGDKELAREMLDVLDRNAEGFKLHLTEQGLFDIIAWNLFDWAPMDTPSEGIITHQNCLAVLGLRQTADLAKRMGQTARAKQWNKLADDLIAAINKHLWSEKKQAYYDCIHKDGKPSTVFSQQTQTAAYISGVASGKRGQRCRSIVEKAPRGFVPAGSPFFMFFVLEGMVREGRFQELVDTIRSYWSRQIAAGATTYWEMYYPGPGRKTRSHCHGWSAAPTFFLSQHVLGVQPLEPGYAKVLVSPQPAGLTWAHGRVPTPQGTVEISWTREKSAFTLNLTLPAKMPVRLELPVSGKVTVEEGKASKVASPRGTLHMTSTSQRLKLRVDA